MKCSRIARTYAQALFNAALELKSVQEVENDLSLIHDSLKSNKEFLRIFCSPVIPTNRKITLVKNIFKKHTTETAFELIRLLLEKRREEFFNDIFREYERLRRENANIAHYVVTSAKPLDEEERKGLLERIQKVTNKQVEAEFRVDPNFIGGLQIAHNGTVYDGTIKDGLRRLRETLSQDLFQHINS